MTTPEAIKTAAQAMRDSDMARIGDASPLTYYERLAAAATAFAAPAVDAAPAAEESDGHKPLVEAIAQAVANHVEEWADNYDFTSSPSIRKFGFDIAEAVMPAAYRLMKLETLSEALLELADDDGLALAQAWYAMPTSDWGDIHLIDSKARTRAARAAGFLRASAESLEAKANAQS